MIERFRVKVGETVRITAGRHRNSNFVVKKIDRKRSVVFLENVSRIISVMNRRQGRRQTREVLSSAHISNVGPTK